MYKRKERHSEKSIKKAELIKDFGINGDAHAGKWHRQVSLWVMKQ